MKEEEENMAKKIWRRKWREARGETKEDRVKKLKSKMENEKKQKQMMEATFIKKY